MLDQTPDNIDAVMRRVAKLLALAEGNANENESVAAAAMAEKIMTKYRLDHAQVYLAKFQQDNEFVQEDTDSYGKMYRWMSYIATSVSMLYGIRARIKTVYTVKGSKRYCVMMQGFKEDVQLAQWTFEYLCNTIKNGGDQFKTKNPGCGLGAANSFRTGMSASILKRIKLHIEQQKAAESVTGRSLVVVKTAAVEKRYGVINYKKTNLNISDKTAEMHGRIEGDKVDIFRKGVTNSQSEQLKINN